MHGVNNNFFLLVVDTLQYWPEHRYFSLPFMCAVFYSVPANIDCYIMTE